MTRNSRRRWRLAAAAGLPVLVVAMAYYFLPRQANLRTFKPESVARIETVMWRHYYEREYATLFRALYALARDEYHFSPWDSTCLAFYAAKAAGVFQRSHSRDEAQRALPLLERYYDIIRARSGEVFDVKKAARLELEWWQLRRERATPAQYGDVVAEVAEELYRTSNDDMKQSGLLRAEMMHYRDERRDLWMEEDDWKHIQEGLTRSYRMLKAGLKRSPALPEKTFEK